MVAVSLKKKDDLKDQSMPADPKKDGYKFTGWVDGNGKVFNGDTVVTGCLLYTSDAADE